MDKAERERGPIFETEGEGGDAAAEAVNERTLYDGF